MIRLFYYSIAFLFTSLLLELVVIKKGYVPILERETYASGSELRIHQKIQVSFSGEKSSFRILRAALEAHHPWESWIKHIGLNEIEISEARISQALRQLFDTSVSLDFTIEKADKEMQVTAIHSFKPSLSEKLFPPLVKFELPLFPYSLPAILPPSSITVDPVVNKRALTAFMLEHIAFARYRIPSFCEDYPLRKGFISALYAKLNDNNSSFRVTFNEEIAALWCNYKSRTKQFEEELFLTSSSSDQPLPQLYSCISKHTAIIDQTLETPPKSPNQKAIELLSQCYKSLNGDSTSNTLFPNWTPSQVAGNLTYYLIGSKEDPSFSKDDKQPLLPDLVPFSSNFPIPYTLLERTIGDSLESPIEHLPELNVEREFFPLRDIVHSPIFSSELYLPAIHQQRVLYSVFQRCTQEGQTRCMLRMLSASLYIEIAFGAPSFVTDLETIDMTEYKWRLFSIDLFTRPRRKLLPPSDPESLLEIQTYGLFDALTFIKKKQYQDAYAVLKETVQLMTEEYQRGCQEAPITPTTTFYLYGLEPLVKILFHKNRPSKVPEPVKSIEEELTEFFTQKAAHAPSCIPSSVQKDWKEFASKVTATKEDKELSLVIQ